MNRTWFICPLDGQAVRIDYPLEDGATDEQWRALIRTTGIHISNDNRKWGPLSKCQLLNWIEANYPDRMPRFFDSKDAALAWFKESKKPVSNEEDNKPPDGAA